MTNENRLSRWSRMKTKSRPKGRGIFFKTPPAEIEEEAADIASLNVADPVDTSPVIETAEPASLEPDEPVAEAEEPYPDDLPPIESLTKESDFTAFMSDRVSDKIRNAALRKLWISNPALANLDGLLDYGEDLTGSFKIMDNMQSAYVVGRGMVDYEAEAKLAEQRALEKEAAEAVAEAEQPDEPASDSGEDEPVETAEAPADKQDDETETEAEPEQLTVEAEAETEEIPMPDTVDDTVPVSKA